MEQHTREVINETAREAENAANSKKKSGRLAERAEEKASRHESVLAPVLADFGTLLEMLNAWVAGDYGHIPWKTLFSILAAVVYFLNPLDLIPDFIAGLGFVDDIAVIQFVVRSIRSEMDQFKEWQAHREEPS